MYSQILNRVSIIIPEKKNKMSGKSHPPGFFTGTGMTYCHSSKSLSYKKRLAGHLLGLRESHYLKKCRRYIAKSSAFS